MLPEWSELWKSNISITKSWCFIYNRARVVGAPTASLYGIVLSLIMSCSDTTNHAHPFVKTIRRFSPKQLAAYSQGINLDILRSTRHNYRQTFTISMQNTYFRALTAVCRNTKQIIDENGRHTTCRQ